MENKYSVLKENADKRSKDSIRKAEDAIVTLLEKKQNINFSIVAKEAGLSRSFLYNNVRIRELIEKHRAHNFLDKGTKYKKEVKTDKSKAVIIVAKDAKIKKLEQYIKELEAKIKKYEGMIYEKI